MRRPSSVAQYRAAVRGVGHAFARLVKPRARNLATEHAEQAALFDWIAFNQHHYPELKRLYAIPNAGAGAQSGQAGKMKAEGVKAGVPDLFLPLPMRGWHGLYIEMKALDGTLAPAQVDWLDYLNAEGYAAAVCYGWESARAVLVDYIAGCFVPKPWAKR